MFKYNSIITARESLNKALKETLKVRINSMRVLSDVLKSLSDKMCKNLNDKIKD